jgi:predicted nucleic acid-binding protein
VTVDKVVDASAIAAFIFNESQGTAVQAQLVGATLHAPALIDVEMASICLKKIRAAIDPRDVILKMYAVYGSAVIQREAVMMTEVIALAERTGLSAYDACYLWLARHLGAELVTLDEKLGKAAARP